MENISLIGSKNEINNKTLQKILDNINSYLKKNRGSVADYELLKDIVDRNLDKEDEKISGNLALPLYLGLMGTMLGVIIGLVFMPELQEVSAEAGENNILSGVNELLNGVKIAMIASALGLLLTIINTVFYFRTRKIVEEDKNELLSFIQINLLPALNQSTANSLTMLQNNLLKFNEEFSSNANVFNRLLGDIQSTSENNLQLIESVESIDLSKIVEYNKVTMEQLDKSFKGLSKFAKYLDQSTTYLQEVQDLNNALRENFEHFANYTELITNLNGSATLLNKASYAITKHYDEVDQRKDQFNALIDNYNADTTKQLAKLEAFNAEKLMLFKQEQATIHKSLDEFYDKLTNYTHNIFEEEGNTFRKLDETLNNLAKDISSLKALEKGLNQVKEEIRNIRIETPDVKIPEMEISIPEKSLIERMVPYFVIGFILFMFFVVLLFILSAFDLI